MAVANNSYISTGADMVSVANKIREKAGVSDGLVFPDGWIEAIEGIEAGSGGGGGVTTLHINVTAINEETMKATFTADKTPAEMSQAAATGPVWCVVTFAAGIMDDSAVSMGVPPAWLSGEAAFGAVTAFVHEDDGSNNIVYAVRGGLSDSWILDLSAFTS